MLLVSKLMMKLKLKKANQYYDEFCRLHTKAFPCPECAAMNNAANRLRAAIEARLAPLRKEEANRQARQIAQRDAEGAYSAMLVEKAKEDLKRLRAANERYLQNNEKQWSK